MIIKPKSENLAKNATPQFLFNISDKTKDYILDYI